MITWLQRTFQKHHKWLFGFLLLVVIVTFVLMIGEQAYFGRNAQEKRPPLDFFGYDLATESGQNLLFLNAQISATLNPDDQVLFRNNLEDYAYSRAAALDLVRQIGIPEPTDTQLESYLKGKSVFQDEDGAFSQVRFLELTDQLRINPRITEGVIDQVLREDWRIEQLSQAVGGPGFAHPFEARMRYIEEATVWEIQVATLSMDAFNPEIEPDEATLRSFYDSNPDRYMEPEKVSVSVVQFSEDAFMDQVPEPQEDAIVEYFERNRARFQKPPPPQTEENPEPEPVEITLEDVRAEVVDAMRRDRARRLAGEAADYFTERLYRQDIARGTDRFTQAVEEFKGELSPLEPYARARPPFQSGIPYRVLTSAFDLDETHFFSEVAQTRNGAAVLIFQELIPGYTPPFEDVTERVREDYIEEERRRLFAEYGAEMRTFLEESVAFDGRFQEAAEEQGMTVTSFGPFKADEPPSELDRRVIETVKSMEAGDVAPMQIQGTQGRIAYVKVKDAPQVDLDSPEVAETLAEMNEMMGAADAWILYHDVAMREFERIRPTEEEPGQIP